jgi:hypothetical protein
MAKIINKEETLERRNRVDRFATLYIFINHVNVTEIRAEIHLNTHRYKPTYLNIIDSERLEHVLSESAIRPRK